MSVITEYINIDKTMKVSIVNSVINSWRSLIQDKKEKNEAFGVLIGSQNHNASKIWIEACSVPQARDKSTRTSFILKAREHQELVDNLFKISNGTLGYLGAWHTHPEPIPTPSSIDTKDWLSCCERNTDRTLIFVIVGISHFCVYRRANKKFERIYMEPL